MNRRSLVSGCALAVLAVVGLTGPTVAQAGVPFKGCLKGSYTVTVNPGPPPIGTFVGSGEGHATHLGHFTYEFPHTVNFGTTPPSGQGTYTFTAANGDTVEAEFTGKSSPVSPGFVLVEEEATITGGTGRFADARGKFTITRLVDQISGKTYGYFDGSITRARRR